MSGQHFLKKCRICGTTVTQCRCPGPKQTILVVCEDCQAKGNKPTKKTVETSIAELALSKLRMDDACPDVGMGMSIGAALDEVLSEHNLSPEDVAYDELLEEISARR